MHFPPSRQRQQQPQLDRSMAGIAVSIRCERTDASPGGNYARAGFVRGARRQRDTQLPLNNSVCVYNERRGRREQRRYSWTRIALERKRTCGKFSHTCSEGNRAVESRMRILDKVGSGGSLEMTCVAPPPPCYYAPCWPFCLCTLLLCVFLLPVPSPLFPGQISLAP